MKQHITVDQLNELSDKAKAKLREWWDVRDIDLCNHNILGTRVVCSVDDFNKLQALPLLSIGQLIEFLDENDILFKYEYHELFLEADYGDEGRTWHEPKDFCDLFWQAVKEVLES